MSGVDFDAVGIRNRKMKEVIETARASATSPAPLLLVGAAGTGKTALAKWIHRNGRGHKLLTTVSLRDEKNVDWQQLFREAGDGTLLIEDIEHASAIEQASLAALLESSDEHSRPRLICTSRREIRSLVRLEQFRQDLYYRIAILTLEIPNLDQRKEDIAELTNFLSSVSCILHGKNPQILSAGALDRLLAWDWPGNVRELENVIERAVTLASGPEIQPEMIQFEAQEQKIRADFGPGMSLSEVERRLILQTLELTAQNRTRAAQMLGISIRTLRNKLNEYKEAGAHESL